MKSKNCYDLENEKLNGAVKGLLDVHFTVTLHYHKMEEKLKISIKIDNIEKIQWKTENIVFWQKQ